MKPYYQDSAVTIYHGDCREVLPFLSFDSLVSDVPYGVGVNYGSFNDSEENVKKLADDVSEYLTSCKRSAVMCGVKQQWLWPKPDWVLAWSYYPTTNQFCSWGYAQWQPVLVYGSDPFLAKGLGPRPTVFTRLNPPIRNGHPCPKPDNVMTWVIERTTDQDDTIVDFCMGSGTTLRAAKDLGRKAIGIDIEERYCEIAARRMSQEVLPLSL